MLIFILPAAFYLRIVKKEPLRSPQKIGVSRPSMDLVSPVFSARDRHEPAYGLTFVMYIWVVRGLQTEVHSRLSSTNFQVVRGSS